jgi:nucleoside-diphosphate-sugar epimerase
MRIILFGGSGFIGTRLSNILFLKNVNFNIFDKAVSLFFEDKFINCDIRDPISNPNLAQASIFINLAAEHRDDVSPLSLYYDTNVTGSINICTAAKLYGVNNIIFISSVAVYGFAEPNTSEFGAINPFNEYGKTKYLAEEIFRKWFNEDPSNRSLTIIRPTVVFGERNRGNVYNLLKFIFNGKFIMVGNGENHKSLAYVENLASFIEYSISFGPGIRIFNYVDKPDLTMNKLVSLVNIYLGKSNNINFRIPYILGLCAGYFFDLLSVTLRKKFSLSSIRVRKFCSESSYISTVDSTGFTPPVRLDQALKSTIEFDFLNEGNDKRVFFTE